jgi:hypothetical protein
MHSFHPPIRTPAPSARLRSSTFHSRSSFPIPDPLPLPRNLSGTEKYRLGTGKYRFSPGFFSFSCTHHSITLAPNPFSKIPVPPAPRNIFFLSRDSLHNKTNSIRPFNLRSSALICGSSTQCKTKPIKPTERSQKPLHRSKNAIPAFSPSKIFDGTNPNPPQPAHSHPANLPRLAQAPGRAGTSNPHRYNRPHDSGRD